MKLFFTRKVKEKMLATRADVIISTQVGPTALVAKHRDLFNGKLISILTDYNIHRYFTSVHKNVDLYCVPTEDLRKKMIELGISEEKVKATGIPVGMKFANGGLINKKKVLKKLGIRNSGDKPVFLFVCGGGNGYANALGCFKKLVNSEIDFNFIFVAGKNGKLRKKAKDISGLCDKDGVCLGYVDYIDELLAVSDLIFGKPGGMMVSEALNMNVPFVAIEPIPGQEIYNAKFINDNNFGIAVNDEKDFEKVLALLKNNPKVIIEWTKNVGENFLNFEFISEKEINKRFVAESVPKVR